MVNRLYVLSVSENNLKTVLLDSSSFSNIFSADNYSTNLRNLLVTNTVRVLVSIDCISEVLAGQNIELVHTKLTKFANLAKQFGRSTLLLVHSPSRWFLKEQRNKGKLVNIPLVINSPTYPNVVELLDNKEKLQEFRQEFATEIEFQKQIKLELHKEDIAFRQLGLYSQQQSEFRVFLEHFVAPTKLSDIGALSEAFNRIGISNRTIRKCLKSKNSYPYLRSGLSVALFRAAGNAFNHFRENDPLDFLHKSAIGNWYDLGFIVMASQSDYLVSDDETQRKITNFLFERSILKCRAISTNELLEVRPR